MIKTLGGLLFLFAGVFTENCRLNEFLICVAELNDFVKEDSYTFVKTAEDLQDECQPQLDTINCVKTFVNRCLKRHERELYEAVTGGKRKLVEELCKSGSDINTKYLEHVHCLQTIQNETSLCQKKFELSQRLIETEIKKDRSKLFFGCCSFDWHRQCKARAAEKYCGEDAGNLVDQMVVTLSGEVFAGLCNKFLHSCHGRLYGVEVYIDNGCIYPSRIWLMAFSIGMLLYNFMYVS